MPNALETPWVTLKVNDVPYSLCFVLLCFVFSSALCFIFPTIHYTSVKIPDLFPKIKYLNVSNKLSIPSQSPKI